MTLRDAMTPGQVATKRWFPNDADFDRFVDGIMDKVAENDMKAKTAEEMQAIVEAIDAEAERLHNSVRPHLENKNEKLAEIAIIRKIQLLRVSAFISDGEWPQ